jgi:hypothetical protein
MEIEKTTFGTITIDGQTNEHDVVIRLSGEVVKRKNKLSKKYHGTSHRLSKDETKFVFEKGCKQLVVGSARFATCVCRRKPRPISQKRTARSFCNRLQRRSRCLTGHMQRRSAFSRNLLNGARSTKLPFKAHQGTTPERCRPISGAD